MKLEWIGHACFRLTAADGTVVITDPYDESVGIAMLPLEADLITMSHEHHDHNEMSMIVGSPMIAHGTQTAQAGSVTARAVGSWHDDAQGNKRGPNAIRIFDIDGLKVVHMGDQGCMPDEEALAAIADADVMMIPAGGTYTVDAQGARAIVERARPGCVIPMHVKTKHCPYPIAQVQPFLAAMGAENAQGVREASFAREDQPKGVLLMQPLADEL
ncbi:MAG: MBL fold metallo-hydrolase [Candidatus Ventricola sp.]